MMKIFVATLCHETRAFAAYDDAIEVSHIRRNTKRAAGIKSECAIEHVGKIVSEFELGDAIHDVTRHARRLNLI